MSRMRNFETQNQIKAMSNLFTTHINVEPLYVETPLLHAAGLSKSLGCNVWLKLENLQPSGSFKIRGIGNFCTKRLKPKVRFICSSGGNAGLAVAYAGRQLGVSVTVVVPSTTVEMMRAKIMMEGGEVIVYGDVWDEADVFARSLVDKTQGAVYVPPFDHEDIWDGHKSIVTEIKEQLAGETPDAIVCSVGGGGLLNGVILGLKEVGWNNVPVVAVETHGANSFQSSIREGKLVTLDKISTIASSLGSKSVSKRSLELASTHPIVPISVSDPMAADACRRFADDHRFLVEAACGASLSVVYSGIWNNIMPNTSRKNIVIIVCGGSNINLEIMELYRKKYTNPPVVVRAGGQVLLKMDEAKLGSGFPELLDNEDINSTAAESENNGITHTT